MYLQNQILTQSRAWMPQNVTSCVTTSMPLEAHNLVQATKTSNTYNQQLGEKLSKFGTLRAMHQRELEQFLQGNGTRNPYTYRQRAVNMAWKYEKADIEMGGHGSENWNAQQRQQILEKGRVKGAIGHHQKNVADHPAEQSDPDNIKIFQNTQQHLKEGHGGDFHNESDSPMRDKNQMLKTTNNKRLVSNELKGAGLAAAISFVTTFTISLIVAAAQDGITPESLRYAATSGGESAIVGTAYYAVGRVVTNHITPMIVNALEKVGIKVTQSISSACSMAITGIAVVAIISTIQFIRLKRKGYTTKDALVSVAKTAGVSLGTMAICIIVCAIWGGVYALIVGVVIAILLLAYNGWTIWKEKHLTKEIQDKTATLLFNKVIFQ